MNTEQSRKACGQLSGISSDIAGPSRPGRLVETTFRTKALTRRRSAMQRSIKAEPRNPLAPLMAILLNESLRTALQVLQKSTEGTLQEIQRSEERREGKECVSKCRSRWSPDHEKKKSKNKNK